MITGLEVPEESRNEKAIMKAIYNFNQVVSGFNAYLKEDQSVCISTTDTVFDPDELDKRVQLMIEGLNNVVHY